MKVAALLVNYRDATATAAAAASVLQDCSDVEVIVVDNSSDTSHSNLLRNSLPQGVRVIDAGCNLGFGAGCNLLVNPDVRLLPGCVGALRRSLEYDDGLAAVAPRQFIDCNRHWQLPPAWLPTAVRGWATEKLTRDSRHLTRWQRALYAENLRCWLAQTPLPQRALSGGAMMIRRASLEGLPEVPERPLTIFDERFFMYFEDSDLCLRWKRIGLRLALIPQAHAVHAWRNAPHKAALMEQGLQTYLAKHFPATDRWQQRRASLRQIAPVSTVQRMGSSLSQTLLQIDDPKQRGWCVEASPHANLWPSVGRIGSGGLSLDLHELAEALSGGGTLHVRLSMLDDPYLLEARSFTVSAAAVKPIAAAQ
jgi:GT2 family glycosyltransferase